MCPPPRVALPGGGGGTLAPDHRSPLLALPPPRHHRRSGRQSPRRLLGWWRRGASSGSGSSADPPAGRPRPAPARPRRPPTPPPPPARPATDRCKLLPPARCFRSPPHPLRVRSIRRGPSRHRLLLCYQCWTWGWGCCAPLLVSGRLCCAATVLFFLRTAAMSSRWCFWCASGGAFPAPAVPWGVPACVLRSLGAFALDSLLL